MAKVNAEVQDLINEVRRYGFAVALEGGHHYKVYKDGESVLGDQQRPVTIPTTPSDHRWYQNTVAHLIRAKVLPDDPKKQGQRPKRRIDRQEGERSLTRLRQTMLAKQRERERLQRPVIDAVHSLYEQLGEPPYREFAKAALAIAAREQLETPTVKAMADHIGRVLGDRSNHIESMSKSRERLWRVVLNEFGVTIENPEPAPEHEPEPEPEPEPKRSRSVPQPGYPSVTTGNRCGYVDPATGEECGAVAKDLRGLRAHQRGHIRWRCKWCGTEMPMSGKGGHLKWCSENPTNKPPVIIKAESAHQDVEIVTVPFTGRSSVVVPTPPVTEESETTTADPKETVVAYEWTDPLAAEEEVGSSIDVHDEARLLLAFEAADRDRYEQLGRLVHKLYEEKPTAFLHMLTSNRLETERIREIIALLK